MAVTLPSEILFMVLDNLGDERDFNSLYQCALASRHFTEHALSVLYRIYDASPLRGGGIEDERFIARRPGLSSAAQKTDPNSALKKWVTLWRSIVLSTLDLTYLPYYSYIRYLDLDDLGNLLGSGSTVKDELFTPELAEFVSREYVTEGNKRRRSPRNLPDNEWIKVKLGSAIAKNNSLIRGMSCDVPSTTLNEWIEGLPQLQSLTVWSGSALAQQAGEKIRDHCPDFRQLRIYIWQSMRLGGPPGNTEAEAEQLFNTLRPGSLEHFEILSFSHLGPRSITALGTQRDSLTELKLTSLEINAIRELPSLGAFPALQVLALSDSAPTAWNEEFYEIVNKVAEWMRSCKQLKRLELRKFMDDTHLLTNVLAEHGIRLSTLSFAGYKLANSGSFFGALPLQQSLEYLYLRGEGSEDTGDNEKLVQAVSDLTNLRELELKDVSDWFTVDHVMALTPFLPKLERLWISGEAFNDSVWDAFSCLPKLKSLVIYAMSNFTADGVIDFITRLGPENKGFSLSILNAIQGVNFPDETQGMIREILAENLQGSFDFGLAQEEFSEADSNADWSD
ncbi:hypothetical protein BJY01DRAFT_226938 [Aspergillus pseudoustus]|uniref:F-box domain-containing protein n=1 Tax=Aspergillus pseudoustus TaxID=1810923 RepID=A0ABR4ISM5_9EURO